MGCAGIAYFTKQQNVGLERIIYIYNKFFGLNKVSIQRPGRMLQNLWPGLSLLGQMKLNWALLFYKTMDNK